MKLALKTFAVVLLVMTSAFGQDVVSGVKATARHFKHGPHVFLNEDGVFIN